MVKEIAYAKINIALEVMEKIDGYHKVNNLMIPINIYDELEFVKAKTIYVENNNIEDNICVKAAKLFLDKYNIKDGVCIKLRKNIPLMAGLAGGSSDAAATLKGLNRLFNINASKKELKEIAKKLGSDVPFFIETKAALCTNKGEVIQPLNIEVPKIPILLIKPKIGLSTKEVYQNYVYLKKDRKDKIFNLIQALKENDIKLLKNNIFNDLSKVALSLSDNLSEIYYNIIDKKIDVFISGSGPTMYLVNPKEDEIEIIKSIIDDTVYLKLCNIF